MRRLSLRVIGLQSLVVFVLGATAVAPGRAQEEPAAGRAPASTAASVPAGSVPGTPAPTDLTVPLAERGGTGAAPTECVIEAAPAPSPTAAAAPDLLMKALGIEDSPVKFYGWI